MPINTFATFMVPMAQDKAYLLILSFIKELSLSFDVVGAVTGTVDWVGNHLNLGSESF
jgi:hypothetical protein